MPNRVSKSEQRKTKILHILLQGHLIPIKDLAAELDVSLMTIHRDLADLENNGAISRVRGAVSAEKSVLFESSYYYRSQKHIDEKRRLAKAAIKYITPGNAIVWDDSTTAFQAVEYIEEVAPVTVMTNGLDVINRLVETPEVDVIALGGIYHRGFKGFFGLQCEEAIRRHYVDVALMSTTTVEGTTIYTQEEQVLRVKRAMMEIAQKTILLIDSSKFKFSALNRVADLSEFDHVLISADTDPETLQDLRTKGVHFEIA